jgi:thiamine-phosphate diphosphorylase
VEAALRRLSPQVAAAGARLIVDDRADVAARVPGVGVHLGQHDGDPREVRRRLGADRLIGWSTHNLEQVAEAPARQVDYIGFGPVFSAAGKHLDPTDRRAPMAAVGLSGLKAAVRLSSLPVVAIGGIGLEQVDSVVATGADAAAVISAVTRAPDPSAAARAIQLAFAAKEDDR